MFSKELRKIANKKFKPSKSAPCMTVNVAVTDHDGNVVLFKRARDKKPYPSKWSWPGGGVKTDEKPVKAAKRELLEETGYGGGQWQSLGSVAPNPAYHDNLCHHFLARGVALLQPPEQGDGEAIEVIRMSEQEIIAAARSGQISHVLALSALARVYPIWPAP